TASPSATRTSPGSSPARRSASCPTRRSWGELNPHARSGKRLGNGLLEYVEHVGGRDRDHGGGKARQDKAAHSEILPLQCVVWTQSPQDQARSTATIRCRRAAGPGVPPRRRPQAC